LDPGADGVWDQLVAGGSDRLRLVRWADPQELQSKIIDELVMGLGLNGPEDELGFELLLGGSPFNDLDRAFFWNRFGDNPGAASRVESLADALACPWRP
jgi:hypothetical protein